jgi:3-phenylpropionate/trans-cinnamate dioxygenase ferredoxin reductase subunit
VSNVPPESPTELSVAIVGASLAGLSTARELRALGHTGAITLIGAEQHLPYDRPPLSKGVLQQGVTDESVTLTDDQDLTGFHWRLGVPAIGLDHEGGRHHVRLDDGTSVSATAVVAATGARARTLIGAGLPGVHTLRTLDDAIALRESMQRGGHLVVIGAGFIGCEVASTATTVGMSVTLVEASEAPGAALLGPQVARWLHGVHTDRGVRMRTGAAIDTINGVDRVESVTLGDGTELAADAVVIGIGALPNSEWAAASGIAIDGGFLTDAQCATAVSNIYAVGDCARVFDPITGLHVRHEHWSAALDHARRAARRLLHLAPPKHVAPYFWSDQYGLRLQVCGTVPAGQTPTFVEGSLDSAHFVAVYGEVDDPVAAVAVDGGRTFTRLRKHIDRSVDRRRTAQVLEHQ